MDLLFSEKGLERMDEIIHGGLLCAFDFDGTLAPIVAQPDKVQLPYDVQQRLITLSRYASIAIITGRSVDDLQKYLGFSPDFIIGNHGIEGLPGWHRQAETYEAHCSRWEQRLQAALSEPEMFGHNIWIENKRYSLSVHYRQAGGDDDVTQRLLNLLEKLEPMPRVIAGKSLFNLVPQNASNKGDALQKLMASQNFHSAIYVGDDITDEDVFRLCRPDVLTVRIEHSTDSAAEFFLRQPQDIKHLLDELIVRLRVLRKAQLTSPAWLAD
jgi:trehalose 6-phosphate phosphatase